MKKLVLLSAVLFGTVVASQAGVHVDVGIGLPFPPIPLPGRVIISHPAPVYVERAPVYVAPRCEPPVVYVPRCEPQRYYAPRPYYGHSGWGDRHGSSWGHGESHHGGHRR